MTDDDNVIRLGHKEMDQMGWPRYDGTDKKESSFGARREAVKDRILPPPAAPMRVARKLSDAQHTHEDGTARLRRWRGGWWQWKGSHWIEVENREVDAAAYAFTEHARFEKKGKDGVELAPWDPNRHKIGDLVDALAAIHTLRTV